MKFDIKRLRIPIAVVVVIAIIAGVVLASRGGKKGVYVYNFYDGIAGMTDYIEGGNQGDGMVSTDKLQAIFLTDTQAVLEIKVTDGQQVKKGDLLFTYDTTLSDIALQQKDLSIQQAKLDLETAKRELGIINSYVPISYHPTPTPELPPEEESKHELSEFDLEGKAYLTYSGKGDTSLTPKYCWLRSTTLIDDQLIEALFKEFDAAKEENHEQKENVLYIIFQQTKDNANDGDIIEEHAIKFMRFENTVKPTPTPTPTPTPPDGGENTPTPPDGGENTPTPPDSGETTPTPPDSGETTPTPPDGGENTPTPPDSGETTPTPPDNGENTPTPPDSGGTTPSTKKTYIYKYTFFNPNPVIEAPEDDGVDMNSGYTAAEIASMRAAKQNEIKELLYNIKVSESEFSIMKKEADSGEVVAEFDGVISNLTTPETALADHVPLMKVSGGGGFYVTSAISELDYPNIQKGQKVMITSWDTQQTYEGSVVEIQEFPREDDNYYGGNQNVSYYPYKIFIDESANLQDGFYVSVTLMNASGQNGLYINNAFLRREGANSYVYVRGANGKLEKRSVVVGGTVMNSYTQIISGITADDWVAFPYGKAVKEGAPTLDGNYETISR